MLELGMTKKHPRLENLEDRTLLEAAKQLAGDERRATAALLRALMEIDSRRLYLGEGCASMFSYCTGVLHLAEGAAYNRIEAARAARRYPLILDLFEQSAITLTAVRLLSPHLTCENHVAVLASARHASKREVEKVAAALKPQPDAPTFVRKLPPPRTPSPVPHRLPQGVAPEPAADRSLSVAGTDRIVAPRAVPVHIAPLAPERYRIQLTISRHTHDKFRRVQALLRHALPSGDAAEIFDRALTLLADQLERQRFAETARPRAPRPGPQKSRHIPAQVRRKVWRRDGGRCAFVGGEGRCAETAFLEFHHVKPHAVGGGASLENIELRCRAHNVYEAQLFFGHDLAREERMCIGGASFRNELRRRVAPGEQLDVW